MQCNTPPANTCNGNAVVSYDQTGVCNDGECTYTSSETECAEGTVVRMVNVSTRATHVRVFNASPLLMICNENTVVVMLQPVFVPVAFAIMKPRKQHVVTVLPASTGSDQR